MKRFVNLLLLLSAVWFVNAQESVTPIPDYTVKPYPGQGCEYSGKSENDGERNYTDGVQMMFTEFPANPLNDFVDCRDFDRVDGTVASEVGAVIGYNATGSADTGGGEVYTNKETVNAQLRYNGGSKGWRGFGQWAFYTVQFPEDATYDFYVGIKAGQNFGFAIYKKMLNGNLSLVTELKEKSTNGDCTAQGTGWGTGSDAYLVNDEAITVTNTDDEYVVLMVTGDATGTIGATNGQIGGLAFVKQVLSTEPTIEFTDTINNTNYTVGATIDLSATAIAVAGTTISSVDFLINGESYGGTPTQDGDVWSGTYTLASAGAYLVQATTTNDKGETVMTEKEVVTAGTDYPFYSYFADSVDTAFLVADNVTEADLIDFWQGDNMCNAAHFDKVSMDTSSVAEDAGVTFVDGENLGPVSFAGHPRLVAESNVVTSIGYNGNPASIENTLGATYYYTVEFPEEGTYNLAARVRGGDGSEFAASLMEYKEINNSTEVFNLDFNTKGLNITSANGDKDTTTMKCSYMGIAKEINVDNAQANSVWIKVITPIVIDATNTGKYLLKVQHLSGGNTSSFAGFSFLAEGGSASLSDNNLSASEKVYSANQQVIVELEKAMKSQVLVYNMAGHCVYNDTFNSSRIVSTKRFDQGIYLVKVITGKSKTAYKVVVQ